jgi:hypothetical protein
MGIKMAAALPYILTVAGTIISASGQREAANAQNKMYERRAEQEQAQANREADILEMRANESQAVGQRKAQEKRRQARIMQSRATAVAASSGAGAVDPSVLDAIGGIAGEGELAAANELYEGNDAASFQRYQAGVTRATGVNNGNQLRYQGKINQYAGKMAATGTIIGGASSLYSMYNRSNLDTGATADYDDYTSDDSGAQRNIGGKEWWETPVLSMG